MGYALLEAIYIYIAANNLHMPTYNPSVESNYIIYEDGNNLNDGSMSEFFAIRNAHARS